MAVASQAQDRGVLVASLVALAVATAVAFGRVFAGGQATLRLIAAATAATALAALFRRRHILVSLVAAAAGLLVAVGALVFPATTTVGLPSRSTVSAITDALGQLGGQLATEAAPAPPLPPLLMTAVVAVWTVAVAAHALAARSRSAVLAVLPSAALVAFAGVVTRGDSDAASTAFLLVAAVGVLFGVGLTGLRLWGPVISWRGRHVVRGATGRAAAWLAAGAVAASLLLPGVVPGYRRDALLTFTPIGDGPVGVTPIVDVRPSLLQNPPAHLFTVRAARPAYWRMLSLDRFDGRVWTSSDLEAEGGTVVQGDATLSGAFAGAFPDSGEELEQEFVIDELSTSWLPAAFEPIHVSLPLQGEGGGAARHDAESAVLARSDETQPGYRYQVISRVVTPKAGKLDRAFDAIAPSTLPDRYTELPDDLPRRLMTIARRITAGEGTPFRKILAIQQHLRTFRYSELAPAGHGSNAMVNFLTETRQGFCVQFAGTMAVLVRLLGYPARVAIGFLPGTPGEGGRFDVTTAHAHVWPEVLFPAIGWVAFEPTPNRVNPVASPYLSPPGRRVPGGQTGDRERVDPGAAIPEDRRRAPGRAPASVQPGADPGLPGPGPGWPILVLLVAAAAAAVALGIAVGKRLARRLALSRAPTPQARAVAAYRVFLAEASDLGLPRLTGETPSEYRARLRGTVRFSDGHLERLTETAARAIYGPPGTGRRQAHDAADAVRLLVDDLRRHVGRGRTARALIRPPWAR